MIATDISAMTDAQQIQYRIRTTSLGLTLVAATDRGVCAILFGDTEAALEQDLAARFPGAELRNDGPELASLADRVVDFIDRPDGRVDFQVDPRGTDFQRRVWQALREIPAGSTASYKEVALRIGAPKAVRAIARACAANPIAVAIPCHRVVRSDGALSGYRWGADRKRALLDREAAL